MPTNLTKHNAVVSKTFKGGLAAWDDDLATWDGAGYSWDDRISVTNLSKHAATITNQPKS